MPRLLKLCSLAVLMAGVCSAQSVVASAIASGPFILGGIRIPVEGVPSWPVFAGDKIASGASLVTITTTDGSRINLDRNSVASVERTPGGVSVRVDQGTASYNLTRAGTTEVTLTRASTPRPSSGSGTVSTIGSVKPVGAASALVGVAATSQAGCAGHWYDPDRPDCKVCQENNKPQKCFE